VTDPTVQVSITNSSGAPGKKIGLKRAHRGKSAGDGRQRIRKKKKKKLGKEEEGKRTQIKTTV